MFVEGQMGVVIGSTKSVGAGPRKGSLGYVGRRGSLSIVCSKEKNATFVLQAAEVYFVRYGLEKKERCERKNVVLILPTPGNMHDDDIKKIEIKIARKLRIIDKIDVSNSYWWTDSNLKWDDKELPLDLNVNFVCMVNAQQINKALYNPYHFTAWINTIKFNSIVRNGLDDLRYNAEAAGETYGVDANILHEMAQFVIENKNSRDFLKSVAKDKIEIGKVAKVIELAKIIAGQRKNKDKEIQQNPNKKEDWAMDHEELFMKSVNGIMHPALFQKNLEMLDFYDNLSKIKKKSKSTLQNYFTILREISFHVLN